MGLAASQASFLTLTSRKSDIGYELQRLSNSKEALTRDMQRVTREYRDALSTKTLKWSANSGITYKDLDYSTLMGPGGTQDNTPYLITNGNGNVVLSGKYAEYAQMIAENGGKYEGDTRYKILSALVGVPVETLKQLDDTAEVATAQKTAMEEARANRDSVPRQNWSIDQIKSKLLSPSDLGYKKSGVLDATSVDALSSSVQNALCGKGYFSSDLETKIKEACKAVAEDFKSHTDNESYKDFKADDFIDSILTSLKTAMGSSDTIKVMIDTRNNNRGTQGDYDTLNEAYNDAQAAYQAAVGANAEVVDSPTKKKMDFYDKLFQAVADMGWEEDLSVSDNNYLNQMLQNNTYYITTMTKNNNYNPNEAISARNYQYFYDTEMAENDPNIFKVNDNSTHEEALVKYEYEKGVINEKESRIDVRMKNLETEQSAITKMLESIDKVKNDNIERTFALWS